MRLELTADEQRMIEASRAQTAITSRPVDKVATLREILTAIEILTKLGGLLDTTDDLWPKLLDLIEEAGS